MLHIRNSTSLTVAATATKIPFDTVVYNSNRTLIDFDKDNNAVKFFVPGYYDAEAIIVFANAGSAAVNATLTAYADGVAIPGATVTASVAATSSAEIVLPWTVAVKSAPSGTAKIEWYVSGAAGTVNNAFAIVRKYN